ncbi:hypothetical protein CDAR_588351 [Caerostris darwini]|uniref:Uncharacterized protein n=1 Tax=Caerostris darwini TaxID=1538125 RepID=A0AAV4SAU0_9ARAC|nr:hypothetical protein CDAR_588351 [Caerostris darwini]
MIIRYHLHITPSVILEQGCSVNWMLIKPTLRSNSSHPRSCRVPRTKRVINRADVYPERNLYPILLLMSGDSRVMQSEQLEYYCCILLLVSLIVASFS